MDRKDLLESLVGLYEAARVIGSTLDGPEIGLRMLQILDRTLGLRGGMVHLHDGSGGLSMLSAWGLESLRGYGCSPEEAASARRRALETGQCHSVSTDSELAGVFVPLQARSQTAGLLEAYGPPLDRESGEFLSSLCAQAAVALHNSQLYDKVVEHERSLQSLVDRMVRVQEDERRRVAHEIHDGLTQTLIAVNHHLEAFSRDFAAHEPQEREADQRLQRLLELSRSATDEARRIAFGLRPTGLEDFGVAAAIGAEIESLHSQGLRISFTDELGGERLPEAVEATLYRIAQEALSNVRKHAGGEGASVALKRVDDEVRLEVSDRGPGFDPAGVSEYSGLGLIGMRERAELVGGRLELQSAAGRGTMVRVVVRPPSEE